MMYRILIRIPLKHALAKMLLGLVKGGLKFLEEREWLSRNKHREGLLSLQTDSISVFFSFCSLWTDRALI